MDFEENLSILQFTGIKRLLNKKKQKKQKKKNTKLGYYRSVCMEIFISFYKRFLIFD